MQILSIVVSKTINLKNYLQLRFSFSLLETKNKSTVFLPICAARIAFCIFHIYDMLFDSNNFSPINNVLTMYVEIHLCILAIITWVDYNTHTWVDFRVQYENEHVKHFVIIMVQYCGKTKKQILIKNPT